MSDGLAEALLEILREYPTLYTRTDYAEDVVDRLAAAARAHYAAQAGDREAIARLVYDSWGCPWSWEHARRRDRQDALQSADALAPLIAAALAAQVGAVREALEAECCQCPDKAGPGEDCGQCHVAAALAALPPSVEPSAALRASVDEAVQVLDAGLRETIRLAEESGNPTVRMMAAATALDAGVREALRLLAPAAPATDGEG